MKNNKLQLLLVALFSLFISNSCKQDDLQDIQPTDENVETNFFFKQYKYLGKGYDVTGQYADASAARNQIIDFGKVFRGIPIRRNIVDDKKETIGQQYNENFGYDAVSFSKNITKKAGLDITIPVFKKALDVAFSGSQSETNKFDSKYIYGSVDLIVKKQKLSFKNTDPTFLNNFLTKSFKDAVNKKSPAQVVKDYGTHLLVDLILGGKLEVKFQSESKSNERIKVSEVAMKTVLDKIFGIKLSITEEEKYKDQAFNQSLYYHTHGGDAKLGLFGSIDLEKSTTTLTYQTWLYTIKPENHVLVDLSERSFIPIYDLVDNPTKKAELKAYIEQYLYNNQVNIGQAIINYDGTVPVYKYSLYFGDWTYSDTYFRTDYFSGSEDPWGNYITNDGIAFYAYPSQINGSQPVHWFHKKINYYKYNHFSLSSKIDGSQNVGVNYYAFDKGGNGRIPVYRYRYTKTGAFKYSTSKINDSRFIEEGIEFYALPPK